jgi:hypothetical protein
MEEELSENIDWNEQWNFKISGAATLFIFVIMNKHLKFQYSIFLGSLYTSSKFFSFRNLPFGVNCMIFFLQK